MSLQCWLESWLVWIDRPIKKASESEIRDPSRGQSPLLLQHNPHSDDQKNCWNFSFLGERPPLRWFSRYQISQQWLANGGWKEGIVPNQGVCSSVVHTSRLCPPSRFNRAARKNPSSLLPLFDIWTPTSWRLRRKTTKGDDGEVGGGRTSVSH